MNKLTLIAAIAVVASVLMASAAWADCVGCHRNASINYSSGSCGGGCGCQQSCGGNCGCNHCGSSCGCNHCGGGGCGCNRCGNGGCGGGCGCGCCPRYPDQYPDPCRTGNPLSDWDRDGTSRHFA